MIENLSDDRRISLQQTIDASMEELRQLNLKPTLDDFQNYWRKKLESSLARLRLELRGLNDSTLIP